MTTSLNISPYFDDFDETKNFHQILFRPGLSVQSRELTQLQSILRGQIEKFGNHIFQHGSVVIPGNSFSNLATSYVKMESAYALVPLNMNDFEGKIVVGSISGIRAVVQKALQVDGSDPVTFYLSYLSGGIVGGVPNGKSVFDLGEDIYVENMPSVKATVQSANATGTGSMAYVNNGVFYINGSFVSINAQSTVISKYNSTPSCHVLLKITESFVDSADDESLLDPAQGSANYAAPGADRLKIELTLTSLPLGAAITNDYVEIMRYVDGVLEEHATYPKYSELEKSLAKRSYDDTGNYVVSGLDVDVYDHKRYGNNNGIYLTGDANKIVYNVTSGGAYIKGFNVETIAPKRIVADKARTSAHVVQSSATIKTEYGQYLLISNPQGALNIANRETVNLYSQSSGGSIIGTAKAIALDYLVGDGTNPIFKLYITNLTMTGNIDDIGSVRTTTPFVANVVSEYTAPITSGSFTVGQVVNFNSTIRTATVAFYNVAEGLLYAYKHSATQSPKTGDTIVGPSATTVIQNKRTIVSVGQAGCIFGLPKTANKSLKTASNTYDLEFISYAQLSIAGGSTTTATVSGSIQSIEVGNFIAINASGIDPISNYTSTGTTIVRNTAAPSATTIYCQVQKSNATPRTKSVVTSSPITKTSAYVVTLDNADVFEIVSVTSGGVDIKNYYTLDIGANDYEYNLSSIILQNGVTLPSGNIVITYKYFNHTAGDFFTVDSYTGLALDEVPTYTSPMTGTTYQLRDCVDFRKSSSTSGLIVSNSILTTSVQRYVPRIDSVCIDSAANVSIISGTPAELPVPPSIPTGLYELNRFFIPAYTFYTKNIISTRIAASRYTKLDIQKIENRISKLEDFSTATAAEIQLIQTPILDAKSGLDRYKTGYLVENMSNPFGAAAAFRNEFAATININDSIFAKTEINDIALSIYNADTTKYQITGRKITLPYTEVIFASVGVSSRTTNLNPFVIVHWEGNMKMTPPSAIWVEVIDNPEIIINRTQVQTVFTTVWTPASFAPAPAPAPAPSPGPNVFGPSAAAPAPTPAPAVAVPVPVGPVEPPAPSLPTPSPVPAPAPAPAPEPQNTSGDGGGGGADGGGAGAGGGGGGGKIICTKLHELGLMSDIIFEADQQFGADLVSTSPDTYYGYAAWAQTVVDWMSGEGPNMFPWLGKEKGMQKTKETAIKWAQIVATPWAEEMAYQMGAIEKGNRAGKAIMSVGIPLCKAIGFVNRKLNRTPSKPGLLKASMMFPVFALFRLIVKFVK